MQSSATRRPRSTEAALEQKEELILAVVRESGRSDPHRGRDQGRPDERVPHQTSTLRDPERDVAPNLPGCVHSRHGSTITA